MIANARWELIPLCCNCLIRLPTLHKPRAAIIWRIAEARLRGFRQIVFGMKYRSTTWAIPNGSKLPNLQCSTTHLDPSWKHLFCPPHQNKKKKKHERYVIVVEGIHMKFRAFDASITNKRQFAAKQQHRGTMAGLEVSIWHALF